MCIWPTLIRLRQILKEIIGDTYFRGRHSKEIWKELERKVGHGCDQNKWHTYAKTQIINKNTF